MVARSLISCPSAPMYDHPLPRRRRRMTSSSVLAMRRPKRFAKAIAELGRARREPVTTGAWPMVLAIASVTGRPAQKQIALLRNARMCMFVPIAFAAASQPSLLRRHRELTAVQLLLRGRTGHGGF